MALEPVAQRLAKLLLTLAAKVGQRQEGLTVVSATRQELADMIGTTVENALSEFEAIGMPGWVSRARQLRRQ